VNDGCGSGSVWSGSVLVLENDDAAEATVEGDAEAAAAALMMSAACDFSLR
jgi:hypothetical protein